MKLKLVVASMSVLGLISCPSYAATMHKHHSTQQNQQMATTHDYKNMGALQPAVTCPMVDMNQPFLDGMSQNVGRAKPTVDCGKPVQLAGGLNFDTLWGSRNVGYQGENNNQFTLNDAYFDAWGNLNNWVHGFADFSYSTDNNSSTVVGAAGKGNPLATVSKPKPGIYSYLYPSSLTLQQGIVTIGDLSQMPVFLKLGKQFQDYGRYQIHPITRSTTQVLTETQATSAEVSFLTNWDAIAFHGSAFTFTNPMGQRYSGQTGASITANPGKDPTLDYGASLGLGQANDQLGWDVGAGYIWNMTGVNDVAYAVNYFNNSSTSGNTSGTYQNRVGAMTVYGMVNSGPFMVDAHYAAALQTFNPTDLTKTVGSLNGASPWAADITAGYGFNYWDKSQNIYLGYQTSNQAVNLFLPQNRWLLGYGMDVWTSTNVGLEWAHDIDYSKSNGGSGSTSNRVNLRVAVKYG